jgi:multidrug efflux pump
MKFLPKFALKYRAVSIMLISILCYLGIKAYIELPKREKPYIPVPFAQVLTYYPGASVKDVETLVTKKLELAFSELGDVKIVSSTSKPGISIVMVELIYGSDTTSNWDKLRSKVDTVIPKLPSGIKGPFVNDEFSDSASMLIAVSGDTFSYSQLEDYAEKVRDRLKLIPSVGKVEIVGVQDEIVNLYTRKETTAQHIPNIWRISQLLKSKNILYPGSTIEPDGSNVKVKTTGRVNTLHDFAKLIIAHNPKLGHTSSVTDFFTFERTYKRPVHTIRHNCEKSLVVSVTMRLRRNVISMGKEIDHALTELRKSLPSTLKLSKVTDQPTDVKIAVNDFMINLIEAILIVLFVAMLFMGFRSGLVMAVAIPMSMLIGFWVLQLIGWDIQTISIAALIISLGMLVDNAIVITDNIFGKLVDGLSPLQAAYTGSAEIAMPVLVSTLTTVAVFTPLAFMPSISGDFIRSIPVVVSVVLLASFLVAMVVTPLMGYYVLRLPKVKKETKKKSKKSLKDKLTNGYSSMMKRLLKKPLITIGVAVLLFIGSLVLLTRVPMSYFPNAESDAFVVEVWLPEGSSFTKTEKMVKRVEKLIQTKKDKVLYITSFIGQGPPRFKLGIKIEPRSSNYAFIYVKTKNKKITGSLVTTLQQTFDRTLAGATITTKEFGTGPQVDNPVEVRIYGENLQVLRTLADKVKNHLYSINGAYDIKDNLGYKLVNVDVVVDDYRASMVNLDNITIAQSLAMLVDGTTAGSFFEGDKEIPIVIRGQARIRSELGAFDIVAFPITSSKTGARSVLTALSTLKPRWDTAKITRRNNSRYVSVTAKVRNILPSEVVKKLKPKLNNMKVPEGYRFEQGGEDESRSEGFSNLGSAMIIGILLIIMLLVIQFNSFRHAAVILGTLPLALIGAILGLYATNSSMGFMAFLGIISLLGVVVNNALVLLDYVQVKIKEGMNYLEALQVAGLRRMRPILLTTLTTVGGLLPLYFTGGAMWESMSAVLIFGLLVSTMLTLIVIPCMYATIVKDRDQNPKTEESL